MPSVIALLERREARAREELDAWLERLREAQEQVTVHQGRVDCARIGREEVLRALAEEAEAAMGRPGPDELAQGPVPSVPPSAEVGPVEPSARAGCDPRPPQWQQGLGPGALEGAYRQVFDTVAEAGAPIAARALTTALGLDPERLNEVEKARHRAYALEARGWLKRVPGGLFIPAPGPAREAGEGGTRASGAARRPSSG